MLARRTRHWSSEEQKRYHAIEQNSIRESIGCALAVAMPLGLLLFVTVALAGWGVGRSDLNWWVPLGVAGGAAALILLMMLPSGRAFRPSKRSSVEMEEIECHAVGAVRLISSNDDDRAALVLRVDGTRAVVLKRSWLGHRWPVEHCGSHALLARPAGEHWWLLISLDGEPLVPTPFDDARCAGWLLDDDDPIVAIAEMPPRLRDVVLGSGPAGQTPAQAQ